MNIKERLLVAASALTTSLFFSGCNNDFGILLPAIKSDLQVIQIATTSDNTDLNYTFFAFGGGTDASDPAQFQCYVQDNREWDSGNGTDGEGQQIGLGLTYIDNNGPQGSPQDNLTIPVRHSA